MRARQPLPSWWAMAGLPADLSVGGLGAGVVEGASTILLRASGDHWLALFDAAHAPEACHADVLLDLVNPR